MKHIKLFENFEEQIELKKLLSHLISIMEDYGYNAENYIINNRWETEFEKEKYSFCVKLEIDNFSKRKFIKLEISMSLRANDSFAKFFMEYLKSIKGMKIISEEYIAIFKGINKIYFKIFDKDVNKIISQITKKDIDSKLEMIKYNI
jgi:hypothetical protein